MIFKPEPGSPESRLAKEVVVITLSSDSESESNSDDTPDNNTTSGTCSSPEQGPGKISIGIIGVESLTTFEQVPIPSPSTSAGGSTPGQEFRCGNCPDLKDVKTKDQHQKSSGDKIRTKCEHCERTFSSYSRLRRHENRHKTQEGSEHSQSQESQSPNTPWESGVNSDSVYMPVSVATFNPRVHDVQRKRKFS